MKLDLVQAQTYRANAIKEQAIADASPLPQVRQIHQAAADRWSELADRSERVVKHLISNPEQPG